MKIWNRQFTLTGRKPQAPSVMAIDAQGAGGYSMAELDETIFGRLNGLAPELAHEYLAIAAETDYLRERLILRQLSAEAWNLAGDGSLLTRLYVFAGSTHWLIAPALRQLGADVTLVEPQGKLVSPERYLIHRMRCGHTIGGNEVLSALRMAALGYRLSDKYFGRHPLPGRETEIQSRQRTTIAIRLGMVLFRASQHNPNGPTMQLVDQVTNPNSPDRQTDQALGELIKLAMPSSAIKFKWR